ncbi:MAG: zf-TFIIB domain-containing protein [Myxococcaceae bacterium]
MAIAMILTCPGCESVLQPYFAKTASGDDQEINRCAFCGGVFVEHSLLADVTGKFDKPEIEAGRTPRRCAHCRTTMEPAKLETLAVEYCRSCTGIYLDDGELDRLSHRAVPVRPPGSDRPLLVACALCQKRVGVTEAIDDPEGRGMLCPDCGHRPKSNELADIPEGLTFSDRSWTERSQRAATLLLDLLSLIGL